MTLSKQARDAIARTVGQLRALFEEEFANQASGRFGLHVKRRDSGAPQVGDDQDVSETDDEERLLRPWVETIAALSLTPAQVGQRSELIGALLYLRREGLDGGEAVRRLIREAAFTAVNRLLAVRVAEAIGAMPEVIAQGRQSAGYREVTQDLFPLLAQEEDQGLWLHLQAAGDELGSTVPLLFDRRLPVSAFEPSRTCIDEALSIINRADVTDAWAEPESLGWAYQFFNRDDERQQMRAESSAPRNSRELAVRNQFFTPRYVVDWLVQNTLGRRLRQAGYTLDLPLLIDSEEGNHDAPLELDDVKILDPACGSGHFLLGCYDLLEQAWATRGVTAPDAAPRILGSLFGIEIDPRASQVAQAVLVLRARRAAPNAPTDPPVIVTARPLPGVREVRDAVFDRLSPNARDLANELDNALTDAPTLGSLLRIEERLHSAFERTLRTPKLAKEVTAELLEQELLDAAEHIARTTDASPAARMFGADTRDAVRFVALCQQRYDTVLMNPPFGEAVQETKQQLRKAYGRASVDLYSAFVARGHELLRPDGYLGALTNRTGFFLRSFTDWRTDLVLPHLIGAADLGHRVLHEALVEAVAYVLARRRHPSTTISFRSLLRESDKSRLATPDAGTSYQLERDAFELLPNHTMSYWVAPSVLSVFRDNPELGSLAEIRQGLATADDFRFVRLWWEVPANHIGEGRRWVPFAKGGEYAPYHADLHLVVDWENDGQRIRETGKGRPQNTEAYYRPGLTWSLRTASGFGLRALPEGSVFSHKGCFIGSSDTADVMAWGNSRPARYLIELQLAAGETTSSGSAARSYEVGVVSSLPYPSALPPVVGQAGQRLAAAHASMASRSETNRRFLGWPPEAVAWDPSAGQLLTDTLAVDRAVSSAYGLDEQATRAIDADMGPAPASYSKDAEVDRQQFKRLATMPMQQLIKHALTTLGAARHLATKTHLVDRRLELLCHLFRAHPATISSLREEMNLLPPDVSRAHARALISYLVGVAFGRWDLRATHQARQEIDPWAPVGRSSSGMLVNDAGIPNRTPPPDYPLELPAEPLLVDDPGAAWDLVARIEAAAKILGLEDQLDDALRLIGVSDLRTHLRTQFAGHHLDTYSLSRRKAPIYWQLSVPSGDWGIWIYSPDLSREVLFAIARTAHEKLRLAERLLGQLSTELTRTDTTRDVRDRHEAVQDLCAELRQFSVSANEIAQSGWEPDLDDGAALCAAPIEPLLMAGAWRDEAARRHQELRQQAYPWASVQRAFFGVDT